MAVEPIATYVLIAINVRDLRRRPDAARRRSSDLIAVRHRLPELRRAEGEYWRLITSGFLHTEFWHIALNMLALFWLGRMIEPALGHARFVAIYFVVAARRARSA